MCYWICLLKFRLFLLVRNLIYQIAQIYFSYKKTKQSFIIIVNQVLVHGLLNYLNHISQISWFENRKTKLQLLHVVILCCILLSVLKKQQPFLCMLSKYCASCNVGKNLRQGKIKYLYFVTITVILILSDFCCLSYSLHTIKVHLLTGLSDYAD